jgi:membrane fusion protein (multidrug efflux system)
VQAGTDSSLLAYIVQADRLYVDLALPEGDAELVRAAHDANPDAVKVNVVDTRGQRLGPQAAIEYIAPRVDDATGTVGVRAVLDNASNSLLPGGVVRARIDGVSVASSLVIPKRSLMHGAQGPFVWVIGAGEKVEPRPVELGAASGNDVVVASGLAAGDRVVVDGILKVQPGAPVRPTMLAAVGAAPAAGSHGSSSQPPPETPEAGVAEGAE